MQSSYIFINGIRLHYLHWNLKGDGRPVVLLHGLASNARIWQLIAPHLAEEDMVVMAPDLRGHGLTDKPDGDYGFETFTKDLASCMDACDVESPLIVGHSWGAMLALSYAARFSFGPRAPAGLVLVDGGMMQLNEAPEGYPQPTWEEIRQRLTPPHLAGMHLDDFLRMMGDQRRGWIPTEELLPIILANFDIEEGEIEPGEEKAANEESTVVERIYPRLSFEHHMQIVRSMWEFPTFDHYRRVRCPVLMLPSSPPNPDADEKMFLELKKYGIEKAESILSDLQVHWLEDTVHDSPLQRPQKLGDLIKDFAEYIR